MTVAGDYHITRAEDWTETHGTEILEREWQFCAHNDGELGSDPANGPNAFVWKAHPEGSPDAWLDWSQGNVYSSDPAPALIAKMQELAGTLRARLVTDDNRVVLSDQTEREKSVFNELIESGRRLLQDQPMQKDDYFEWSDATRVKMVERYGTSPKAQEFSKARWEIATTLEADPSSYLTQIGANLRRELRTLEKFQRDRPV